MKAPLRLFLLLPLLASSAARADDARVDTYVRAEIERRKIPGLSVAVVQDGKVVLARGWGMADTEKKLAAGPDTVYQLASVTKQFTATAIMLLAEDGKLSLDDPISKRLPDTPPAWKDVTIRHLLTHTSGIPSYTSLPDFAKEPRRDYTHKELIALVRELPLEFKPGERMSYDNTGYYLLGMIIEGVSGKSYNDFLTERIFRPLGMTATRLNDRAATIPQRAQGYSRDPSGVHPAEFVSPTQPFAAGALISTVQDMAKWDLALYTDNPLKSALREQMWTPTRLNAGGVSNYGFGWELATINGRKVIQHGGGIPGFSTEICRCPELKFTVILLSNLDSGDARRVAAGIAALYHPELAPKLAAAIQDDDPKTTASVRALLLALAEGKASPDDFAPKFREFLFPDRVKEAQQLFTQFGPLKTLVLLESSHQGEIVRRRYRATFGETNLSVGVVIDKDGKYAGLGLMPE